MAELHLLKKENHSTTSPKFNVIIVRNLGISLMNVGVLKGNILSRRMW